MARKPIEPGGNVALLRPVASPVDTYVRPGRSNLRDVAESLASIEPELKEFLDGRARKEAEADKLRGEAAFYRNNSEGYAEAVRSGKIPAQSSPAFVRAYKNAQGNVAGHQLEDRFWQDYVAWSGKYNEDADFDTWTAEWIAKNIGTDDPDVLKGILPHVGLIQQNGRAKYTADRHEQVYGGHLNTSIAVANRAIEEGDEAGLASETGTDYAAVFGKIDGQREAWVKSGGRGEDFDKAMVDAMSAKVLSLKDPQLLKWFDRKIPGKDITYGEDAYGAIVKKNTVEALEVIARRATTEDAERQRKEDQAHKDAAHRQAVELLAKDPAAPIPDELLREGEKYDPTFKVRIEEWRKALGEGFSDPDRVKAVYSRILEGQENSYKIVQDAFTQGVFGRPEDLTAAYNFAKSFEDNRTRLDDALGSSTSKSFESAIDIRTKGKNKETLEPIAGMSNEGYEATYDYRRMVQEWVLANPSATLMEREDAINKIGKQILDRITDPSEAGLEAGTYDRPADADFANPFTKGTAPIPNGQPQQHPASPQEDEERGDVESYINGLSPGQLQVIDEQAKARGLSREDAVRERLGIKPRADAGEDGLVQKASYSPSEKREVGLTPEQATAFIDEALAASTTVEGDGAEFLGNDASTGLLLSLIRRHEAAGNYNAVFGQPKASRDLSDYSVDQILAQQVAARRRGAPSTAIGGYQFIYKTLRSLKDDMGLSGSERFTPELQDCMAVQLLKRRGWDTFRAGNMSKRQFAFRLSQEWASLPNPTPGAATTLGTASTHLRPRRGGSTAPSASHFKDTQWTRQSSRSSSRTWRPPSRTMGSPWTPWRLSLGPPSSWASRRPPRPPVAQCRLRARHAPMAPPTTSLPPRSRAWGMPRA